MVASGLGRTDNDLVYRDKSHTFIKDLESIHPEFEADKWAVPKDVGMLRQWLRSVREGDLAAATQIEIDWMENLIVDMLVDPTSDPIVFVDRKDLDAAVAEIIHRLPQ